MPKVPAAGRGQLPIRKQISDGVWPCDLIRDAATQSMSTAADVLRRLALRFAAICMTIFVALEIAMRL